MLDNYWRGYLARLTKPMSGKDVDLSNYISVRLKPAGRAAIIAPPGFMSMSATWTSLTTVGFVLQFNGYSFGYGLVLREGANLTVIPSTNFLIDLLAQVDPIGYVPHVTYNDGISLALNGYVLWRC